VHNRRDSRAAPIPKLAARLRCQLHPDSSIAPKDARKQNRFGSRSGSIDYDPSVPRTNLRVPGTPQGAGPTPPATEGKPPATEELHGGPEDPEGRVTPTTVTPGSTSSIPPGKVPGKGNSPPGGRTLDISTSPGAPSGRLDDTATQSSGETTPSTGRTTGVPGTRATERPPSDGNSSIPPGRFSARAIGIRNTWSDPRNLQASPPIPRRRTGKFSTREILRPARWISDLAKALDDRFGRDVVKAN
jgi:hypothetical protein